MTAQPVDEASEMSLTSGVSLFDGAPFVVLEWGGRRAQLTPHEARGLGIDAFRAAEAADFDAGLVAVVRRAGMPDEVAAALLSELRAERDQ